MQAQRLVPVTEQSQVAEARRVASVAAQEVGFNERETGTVSLVATELATNLVKHAAGGRLILRTVSEGDGASLEILSLDQGPGIGDIGRALHDGFSTAGSYGTGLGAVRRAAQEFDVQSVPGKGTVLVTRLWKGGSRVNRPARCPAVGVVSLAKPGEPVCGDQWVVERVADGWVCGVADGLGHGQDAFRAAAAAIETVHRHRGRPVGELIEEAHEALRPTRGAALGVASLDRSERRLWFAGIGNITAAVLHGGQTRRLVSHNGTVGHGVRKIGEFSQSWADGGVLIMHSDGISTHWDLMKYPGLLSRDPSLIAAVLYRDFLRGRDDATVVVVKETVKS